MPKSKANIIAAAAAIDQRWNDQNTRQAAIEDAQPVGLILNEEETAQVMGMPTVKNNQQLMDELNNIVD